jgi:hypothetical protein
MLAGRGVAFNAIEHDYTTKLRPQQPHSKAPFAEAGLAYSGRD